MRESRDIEPDPLGAASEARSGGSGGEKIFDLSAMTPSDLVEVAALEKLCFQDPWSRTSFEAELAAAPVSWCRVLRQGDRLAGYMIAWFVEDEAHLANIAVDPAMRRQGLAQKMLDHLFEEAYLRGSRMIVLEVRMSNAWARHLYERNGFVPGGIRKNYYSRPREDAIVMVRSLRLRETP